MLADFFIVTVAMISLGTATFGGGMYCFYLCEKEVRKVHKD